MKTLILVSLFVSNCVFAFERITTKNIRDVQTLIDEKKKDIAAQDILVVFDFDNTLMAMNQDLGSDQWYGWQSKAIGDGNKKEMMANSKSELFQLHYKFFALGDMHLVEKSIADVVKKIQEQKIKSFVMTSRGSDYRNDTESELDRGGLSFKDSAIGPVGGYVSTFLPEGTDLKREISYQDGILMGSGQDKGLLLQYILKKTQSQFKLILFVDDTLKNIENVERAYKEDKSVYTFYYTHEEERVKKFEKDKSNVWREWKKIKPVIEFYDKENSKQN